MDKFFFGCLKGGVLILVCIAAIEFVALLGAAVNGNPVAAWAAIGALVVFGCGLLQYFFGEEPQD